MLVRDVYLRDAGIEVFDMDGSSVTYTARDALDLAAWILQKRDALYEIMRREMKKANEARKDD